jgi:hypothetical protein
MSSNSHDVSCEMREELAYSRVGQVGDHLRRHDGLDLVRQQLGIQGHVLHERHTGAFSCVLEDVRPGGVGKSTPSSDRFHGDTFFRNAYPLKDVRTKRASAID